MTSIYSGARLVRLTADEIHGLQILQQRGVSLQSWLRDLVRQGLRDERIHITSPEHPAQLKLRLENDYQSKAKNKQKKSTKRRENRRKKSSKRPSRRRK